ncbi:patatin-like phospholipase family protein [Rathayibacter sp. YIM 133350]|uniref:patatin-like phospholipase family protein n=1 Tax=Rathayibacter sp. YIM 133350 TaxID=3131992 RepID=UPI00307D70E9
MNTSPSSPLPSSGERALVLGGGGSTGNAWLIAVLAGLFDAGLDVTAADLTIGTSAGATAAAQIANAAISDLYAATLSAPVPQRPADGRSGQARASALRPTADHLARFRQVIASSQDAAHMRRTMGAAALERDAACEPGSQDHWRATVAARLPGQQWPTRRMLLTAVDARTGEPVEFDGESGVDLVDAVAASTSGGGSAYRIGDGRYIDGGYRRSSENADLAAGYGRVLVLSPLGGKSLYPQEWNMGLAVQVDELRAGGSRVETVVPDAESEHLFGANAMDASLRPAAARAGHDQGAALAERLDEFWR